MADLVYIQHFLGISKCDIKLGIRVLPDWFQPSLRWSSLDSMRLDIPLKVPSVEQPCLASNVYRGCGGRYLHEVGFAPVVADYSVINYTYLICVVLDKGCIYRCRWYEDYSMINYHLSVLVNSYCW